MIVVFHGDSFEEYSEWAKTDIKIFEKIKNLIKEIKRNPFQGTGKPEPLKYDKKGYWSRRINNVHRLVYKITEDSLIIVSCKYHYDR